MKTFYSFYLAKHQSDFLMQEAERLEITPSELLGQILDQYMEGQSDTSRMDSKQEGGSSSTSDTANH